MTKLESGHVKVSRIEPGSGEKPRLSTTQRKSRTRPAFAPRSSWSISVQAFSMKSLIIFA
jgi:hypothetical protein